MNKLSITVALAASSLLAACASTGHMPPADQVSNGEYHVYVYPGNLPHVAPDENNKPAEFGPDQFEQMVYLDRDCRTQMAKQTPSALKSVGTTTLRTAVPIAIL